MMEIYSQIETSKKSIFVVPFDILRSYYSNNLAVNTAFLRIERALQSEKTESVINDLKEDLKALGNIKSILSTDKDKLSMKEIDSYIAEANKALTRIAYIYMWAKEFDYLPKNDRDEVQSCLSSANDIVAEIAKLAGRKVNEKKIPIF